MRTTPTIDEADPQPMAPTADAADDAPARLRAALHAAATLAVDAGLDLDAWMQAAWTAYVEHQPGLRAHLEEVQLANQIDELRQRGQVGQA